MSYDLQFHDEENQTKILSRSDLEKLNGMFSIKITKEDSGNRILDFEVMYKDNNPEWLIEYGNGFEVYYLSYENDDGVNESCYSSSISYSADQEMFNFFGRLMTDLAKALHWKILDPQLGGKPLDPDEYLQFNEKSNQRFDIAQTTTKNLAENLSVYVPADETFFIKLFIQSFDGINQKRVLLLENGDQMYCSKVVKGQSVYDVLKEELPPLIGTKDFLVTTTSDTGDFDYDRHGNKLKRINVFIEILYFDPKERNLNRNMKWVTT